MAETGDILFERRGALGLVLLNRPKALNALTHAMCLALDAKLREWETDRGVHAVVLRGAGERAFCAGGDVREIHRLGRSEPERAIAFFRDEYRLNARIKRFAKPYISLLDGITMGGGFGLSVHGDHRVATPRTLFAMPEAGIGMFPDVGGGHFLPRCPGGVGLYLALTGARIGAADAIHAGVAQYFVRSERLDELVAALAAADFGRDAHRAAHQTIARFAEPAGEAPLAARRGAIDRIFALPTVEAIVAALAREPAPFGPETLAMIAAGSPTSQKLALRQLREGAKLSFDDNMRMEFRMVRRIVAGHDFYEGVGAALIDKGRKPVWRPGSLAEVTDAMVDAYFAPAPGGELGFDWD